VVCEVPTCSSVQTPVHRHRHTSSLMQERPVHCPVSIVNSDSEKVCNASRSGELTGRVENSTQSVQFTSDEYVQRNGTEFLT